jgi:hypothetical protein
MIIATYDQVQWISEYFKKDVVCPVMNSFSDYLQIKNNFYRMVGVVFTERRV